MIASRLDHAAEQHPRLSAKRVLIVDDHLDTREIYGLLLRGSGYVVYEAADGRSALDVVEHTPLDVVILDIGLPDIDGYQIAKKIRSEVSHTGMLLIAVTGYGSPEDRERARLAGFDRHLVKPITPEQFLHALD